MGERERAGEGERGERERELFTYQVTYLQEMIMM